MNKTIKIGTRKSALAMAQTYIAEKLIKDKFPYVNTEIVQMTTRGDKILDKPLNKIGGKGVFVEEFENALLNGKIDIAVHSGKDLPAQMAKGLTIGAVPKRADSRDVLVTLNGRKIAVGEKCVLGTGSLRRIEMARKIYINAVFKNLRGNVNTRLKKLSDGEYDGIILACAGLERLGISKKDGFEFEYFDEKKFVPAACQAIIAIQCRENDKETLEILSAINDKETFECFSAERKLLSLLGADCHEAAGIFSTVEDENMEITAFYKNSPIKTKSLNKADTEKELLSLAGELK